MRGVICQKPSDLAEKLTCEPETDIRHCAASPELWAQTGPAAVRHAVLDLAGFGATNRMTGPSPKQTRYPQHWREGCLCRSGGERSFAVFWTNGGGAQKALLLKTRQIHPIRCLFRAFNPFRVPIRE